jgi:two-component system response regulator PilR (NtrC family)
MATILVVDDEKSLCEMLDITFRKEGHRVETATSLDAARKRLGSNIYDVIVSDIRLPEGSGLDVVAKARETDDDAKVILMTAAATLDTAVKAVNMGAFGYIIKTPNLIDELRPMVLRAIEIRAIKQENRVLRRELKRGLENLLGQSATMKELKELVATVASTGSTILITGESGTGKELVARAIHACSPRKDGAFVSVNCGAFPETLLESELFGYMKGSFTGATGNRQGLFEAANGGTLFLDEVGETTPAMQVKLLRVLQERAVRPLGASAENPIDVRVICATNRDLQQAIVEKTFREDLYYRINVIPVELPALRERRGDILLLARHFLNRFREQMSKRVSSFSQPAATALEQYNWPGNVRELENLIERAVALSKGEEITPDLLPERVTNPPDMQESGEPVFVSDGRTAQPLPPEGLDLEQKIAEVESGYIRAALQQADGVRTKAADLLRMSYRSFRHYAKKYRL